MTTLTTRNRPATIAMRSSFALPGDVYNATPPRIVFGAGTFDSVAEEARRLKAGRVLVLSTPGRAGLAEAAAQRLGELCAGVYPEAVSQVPIELAERARAHAERIGADCLLSVGGGASTGLAKAVALHSGLPFIAVATTYSGSEMTGFCGITIDGVKRMHTSLRMLARTVIYDPELTLGLPAQVSADSGMNALAHCIEALYVSTASPIIALAALEGVRALAQHLPQAVQRPDDLAARTGALYGAYLAGAALTGGFALHHGVAHVLGASYGLPHAISHSVALPYVTAFNEAAAAEALRPVAEAFGTESAAAGIHDFAGAIGSPTRLGDFHFTERDLDRCTEIVLETDNGLNPRPVEAEGVRSILQAALGGGRPGKE